MVGQADPIDYLLSLERLRALSAAYCSAIDRADGALLASLFHPDGVVRAGDMETPIADYARDAIAATVEAMARTWHALCNERFAIVGDRATGETYVQAIAAGRPDGEGRATDFLHMGRYLDLFERRDGQWLFLSREFVIDWTSHAPAHPIEGSPFRQGARGEHDPAWQHLQHRNMTA